MIRRLPKFFLLVSGADLLQEVDPLTGKSEFIPSNLLECIIDRDLSELEQGGNVCLESVGCGVKEKSKMSEIPFRGDSQNSSCVIREI